VESLLSGGLITDSSVGFFDNLLTGSGLIFSLGNSDFFGKNEM
jgi:hypothetical protein